MDISKHRVIRLSDAELTHVQAQLDTLARSRRVGADRRTDPRYDFRNVRVLIDVPQGEGYQTHLAPARDLSRRGLSGLLGLFIYPGTPVRVHLVSEFNLSTTVTARVRRCRYVEGSRAVYEVGLAFDSPIDVSVFNREALAAQAAVLTKDSLVGGLVSQVARKFGVQISTCELADQLLEKASKGKIELILVDHDAEPGGGCQLVARLLESHDAPVIACLSSGAGEELTRQCPSGGRACQAARIQREELVQLFQGARREPIVSSMAGDAEMAPLIDQFVAELPRRVAALRKALVDQDLAGVSAQSQKLASLADACGFEPLAVIAGELARAPADDPTQRDRFQKLVRACLATRPASANVAND